jgi:hypothetical protein
MISAASICSVGAQYFAANFAWITVNTVRSIAAMKTLPLSACGKIR